MKSFRTFIQEASIMAEKNMYCLGPIGDHLVAERRWGQMNSFFEVNFCNPKVFASDKGLRLEARDYNNSILNDLLIKKNES